MTREELLAALPPEMATDLKDLTPTDFVRFGMIVALEQAFRPEFADRRVDIIARVFAITDYLAVRDLLGAHIKDGELDQARMALRVLAMMREDKKARKELVNLVTL